MTVSPEQLLMPIPAACTALGNFSRTTLYELVKQRQLVKVNIGTRGFITAESLTAYVDRLSEAATACQLTNDPPVVEPTSLVCQLPRSQTLNRGHTVDATQCTDDPRGAGIP
jgi:hypothetical protein